MGSLCMLQLTQKFFASSSMCSLRLLVDDGAGASLAMPDLFSSSPGLAEHFDHQSPEEGEHVASNVPNRTVLTLLGALRASGWTCATSDSHSAPNADDADYDVVTRTFYFERAGGAQPPWIDNPLALACTPAPPPC